jgi:hypothetical protein
VAAAPPRFRAMRDDIGNGFVVVDSVAIKIYEFASREEADQDCARRNGEGRQKTSEPAELPSLREKLRKGGVLSPEESAVLKRPRERDLKPVRPRHDPQLFVDQIRKVLPSLCRAWGCEVARQSGIDDALRRAMTTDEVVTAVGFAAGLANTEVPFSHHTIGTLDEELRPIRWTCLEDEGFRGAIAVHYLSSDPARLKAGYLGLSRTDYFRKLDEGHRWLTRCLAAEYDGNPIDFDPEAQDAMERDITDGGRSTSDDDYWGIDPGDLDGFGVEKLPF